MLNNHKIIINNIVMNLIIKIIQILYIKNINYYY